MRRVARRFSFALVLASLALPAGAATAAPRNDDFAKARTVRAGTTVKGNVNGATGQRGEPRVVQQQAERFQSQTALSNVLVPVDTAATRLLRVVQVPHLQPVESDERLERVERRTVALFSAQVVARGEQMTGVQAHAQTR